MNILLIWRKTCSAQGGGVGGGVGGGGVARGSRACRAPCRWTGAGAPGRQPSWPCETPSSATNLQMLCHMKHGPVVWRRGQRAHQGASPGAKSGDFLKPWMEPWMEPHQLKLCNMHGAPNKASEGPSQSAAAMQLRINCATADPSKFTGMVVII